MTIEVIDGGRGYAIHYQGPLSYDEVLVALQVILEQPGFVECRYVQHNLLRSTVTEVDRTELRQCALRIAALMRDHPVKHCLVCRSPEMISEFSGPFLLAQLPVEVFQTPDEASFWADAATGFADLLDEMRSA